MTNPLPKADASNARLHGERRSSQRTVTDEAATIVCPNGRTRLPCRVINYSEGGVLLRTCALANIPPEFVLRWHSPEVRIVCRIVWRIGSQTGCEFIHRYTSEDERGDWILPIAPQRIEKIIETRTLKRPLIIN